MGVFFDPERHEYRGEDGKIRPSVTQILKHFGMTPDFDKFGNDTARNFGTVVHRICELYDKGELGSYEYDHQIDPWLSGYKKFLDAFRPEWEVIEDPLISNAWGYAGTPDRVGLIKGIRWGVDLKTGAPEPAHELQTAGYEVIVEECLGLKTKKRFSLYIMQDDFRLIEHKNKSDRAIFLGLVKAFAWKANNKLIGGTAS